MILIVFIGLNVWKQRGEHSAEGVETVSLKEETIEETVIVPGKLKLADEQVLYYQADKGEIDEVFVNEGDTVEKGTALLRYTNESLLNEKQQNELQERANQLELKSILKQHREIDKQLDKDKDNDQLQAEHDDIELREQQKRIEIEQTQLEKESIERQLANTKIQSDINGTVVSIDEDALAGSEQAEQHPVMQIGSLDALLVKGEISEYDTLKIRKDQPVKLTSDAVPDQEWKGKVSLISDLPKQSELDEEDSGARYAMEVTVDEDEINLKPGFEMLMEIETAKKKAQVLPLAAVAQDGDTDYVYVIEDGKANRKEVKLGTSTNEMIEIKDGLDKKAKVILNPAEVSDGMEVAAQ